MRCTTTPPSGAVTFFPMTYLEAALEVLRNAERPLTTRQVVDEAVERGLIAPTGKTPDASMSAALYGELHTSSRVLKLAAPGPTRAARGTVRWVLRDG